MSPTNRIVSLTASLAVAGACSAGSTVVRQFQLHDHPDAFWSPPPYGLRLDGLFQGLTGAPGADTTTFSFDTFGDVVLSVIDTAGVLSINISGTVFGGEDIGTSLGFGAGAYALEYNYVVGAAPMGTGYIVMPPSVLNSGSLTALGDNSGVAIGTVFNFFDSFAMPKSFEFLQDGHRLGNHPGFEDAWVGRGWMDYSAGGSGSSGYQDWLFIGEEMTFVPLPTGAAMGAAGLTGLCVVRRRRAPRSSAM